MTILDALHSGALAGAREVRLDHCGLTEVPREIFGLADTLEILDLGGNALTTLPDDFGRLKKLRALFCSGNPFSHLPPVLGTCERLSQIGFRGCGMREVPAESLPPGIRWLTLTDNALESLPDAIGQRPALQKLMLAGNRLRALPETLCNATDLELLRIAANGFDALPPWLLRLPRLAWLAWAGNPLEDSSGAVRVATVDWTEIEPGPLLGEGASGRIHQALWRGTGHKQGRPIALKLFKGSMTSDGLPASEMAACLTAGEHPNLIGSLGRLVGHPQGLGGLLMPLVPGHWPVLAGPPSLESCSRDVYDPPLRLDIAVVLRLARGVGSAAAHLHARGLLHGDLYAHNILWDGRDGHALLSDFGAASFMPGADAPALERLDVLAWGLLLGELLDRCDDTGNAYCAARGVQEACVSAEASARPRLAEALDALC